MKRVEHKILHCVEGNSDKIYEVDLCEVSENKYLVNFRFGRRGASLKEGTKTNSPVDFNEAKKLFNELVSSKTKKGYNELTQEIQEEEKEEIKLVIPKLEGNNLKNQAVLKRLITKTNKKNDWKLTRAIYKAGQLKIKEAEDLILTHLENTFKPTGILSTAVTEIFSKGNKYELEKYTCIWALGFLGGEKSIIALEKLLNYEKTSNYLKRITIEALVKLYPEDKVKKLKEEKLETFPNDLKIPIKQNNPNILKNNLVNYLSDDDYKKFEILSDLYFINDNCCREALLGFIKNCPFTPNYFKQIRYIFKIAEYKRDGEVFGLIAHRFEKEKEIFKGNSYNKKYFFTEYNIDSINLDKNTLNTLKEKYKTKSYWNKEGLYIKHEDVLKELKAEDSKFCFSRKTKNYLKKRITRTLRELGENNDLDFIKMAVGVLLPYKDEDKEDIKISVKEYTDWNAYYKSNYRVRNNVVNGNAYKEYAKSLALNFILYKNSEKFKLKKNGNTWSINLPKDLEKGSVNIFENSINNYLNSDTYKKLDENKRTEAFSNLWDKNPLGLIHLIIESECELVHDFATKALLDHKKLWEQLDEEALLIILSKKYLNTLKIGLEIAKVQYEQTKSLKLIKSLANANYILARKQAFTWIGENREIIKKDPDFIFSLISSNFADTRELGTNLLSVNNLSEKDKIYFITKTISTLKLLNEDEKSKAKDISNALIIAFPYQLEEVGLSIAEDLLEHKLEAVQLFGCYLINNKKLSPQNVSQSLIDNLINSEYESVRAFAIKILSKFPEENIILRKELILSFCVNKLPDIRKSILPLLMQIIKFKTISNSWDRYALETGQDSYTYTNINPETQQIDIRNKFFAENITRELFTFLKEKNNDRELLKDVCLLIENNLVDLHYCLDKDLILEVLKSKNIETQELCGKLLQKDSKLAYELELLEIVKLSNHEIKSVREASWKMILVIKDNILNSNENMSKIIRFFDSKKEDTRKFACEEFSKYFYETSWSTEFLISLCDSIYEDIRVFARNSIMNHFKSSDGQLYLAKLSEHPSSDIQLFATNYLEAYCFNDLERLTELKPYFKRVLSNVNKSRTAKNRILSFLQKEANNNFESALLVAEILNWYSATVAIGDKAKAIEILLNLQENYPDLNSAVKLVNYEIR